MNNRAFIVMALSGSFAAGLLVGESKREPRLPSSEIVRATGAAFRDGLFQARLDVKDGRRPHLAVGRWNAPEDRAAFVSGYWTAYRASNERVSGRLTGPSVAELAAAGYRDGMLDGNWHRIAGKSFQAEETTNYQAAGAAYLGMTATPDEFKYFYREGYMNGYKLAYFLDAETQAAKPGR